MEQLRVGRSFRTCRGGFTAMPLTPLATGIVATTVFVCPSITDTTPPRPWPKTYTVSVSGSVATPLAPSPLIVAVTVFVCPSMTDTDALNELAT
jgi:hypothetical protein